MNWFCKFFRSYCRTGGRAAVVVVGLLATACQHALTAIPQPTSAPRLVATELVGTVVTSGDNAALPGVSVSLCKSGTRDCVEVLTDTTGAFRVVVAPGRYEVSAVLPGFFADKKALLVQASSATTLAIKMTPAVVEEISVTATVAEPVYNAIFSPNSGTQPLRLRNNVPTKVQFFIDMPAPQNAIPNSSKPVPPRLLKGGVLDLAVTIDCLVCQADRLQTASIRYSDARHRSTKGRFNILPTSTAAEPDGSGTITFTVTGQGVEYSHIVVPVQIVATATGAPTPSAAALPAATFYDAEEQEAADLILSISPVSVGSAAGVQIRVPNAELQASLGSLLDHGVSKPLRTGISDSSDLDDIRVDLYAQLRQLVDGQDATFGALLKAGGITPADIRGATLGKLTPSDRDKVDGVLMDFGELLYNRIFLRGSPQLQAFAKWLDGRPPGAKPLRIRIETSGFEVPWQLLVRPVPERERDLAAMWGLKFELAVRPLDVRASGALLVALPTNSGKALFIGYDSTDRTDTVTTLTKFAHDDLAAVLGDNFEWPKSKADFLTSLVDHDNGLLTFVLSFTHGSTGSFCANIDGHVGAFSDDLGPRLYFREADVLRPVDVERRVAQETTDGAYSPVSRAFVLLNACETGTSGFVSHKVNSFARSFLDAGATGVVVTEAPVWAYFAYHFGQGLVERLAKGERVAQAIREERLRFLSQSNNPLGLAYSYYGTVGTAFEISPDSP
jgi:Carboxypeptidase regulatory-like domain/CHAT domain